VSQLTPEDLRAIDTIYEVVERATVNPQSLLAPYVQIALYLRGAIIARQLPPGTPLPSEPELVTRYQVSRETVRRALQLLRDLGLAESRRGIGHFVARTPDVRRVEVSPGARVLVRMPQPGETQALAYAVLVVVEPGKEPAVYDTATTVLAFTAGKKIAAIDTAGPELLRDQLADSIREDIRTGRVAPRTRLMSQQEMCDHFGVSRTTVVKALQLLADEGLIRWVRGRGYWTAEADVIERWRVAS
jgi:DNA-binding GntR family transcriptional regulator